MSRLTTKIASVGLAFATAATFAGALFPTASAQTVDINALLAQIAQLTALVQQLQAAQGSGSMASTYNFTRNLTLGSTGADVKALQQFLNANGAVVATSGAGSVGNESQYFGSLTQKALAAWQAANGVSPAVGYFGPISRAKIASITPSGNGGDGGNTGGTPAVVPAGTDLLVSLASDSPSARTIGSGTAFNPAMKFVLSAGSKNVTINSITVQKSGFVSNTNTNGVDLVDANGMRYGNVVSSINADNTILLTFGSSPIVVTAGTSQTFTLRFNLVSGSYTGTIAFNIPSVSSIVADTSAISGSFPIVGGTMNIVDGGSSLASTTLDVQAYSSSSLNADPASEVQITKFRIQETSSNEAVKLYSLKLYNYGNAADTDYMDVQLQDQTGTVLATAQPSGQYVNFDLSSNPYLIDKGQTKDFTVWAKIIGGTTRTIQLVVYNNYDIDLRGVTTGVSVIPGAGSNDTSFPIGNGWNIQTIQSGTTTFSRSVDSPSSAVVPGSSDVTLAKFTAKPAGENMELRQVSFYVATSSTGIALTGTVYVKVNGAIVYSTAASNISTTAASTVTLSSYPILTSGVDNTVEVTGSVSSNATSVDTYTVTNFDLIQVKRIITGDLTDPSVSAINGNQIAVKAANLAVTTLATPVSASVVAGTNDFNFAQIQLNAQAGGEDVRITSIVVTDNSTSSTDITNLRMYSDSSLTSQYLIPVTGSTASMSAASNGTVTFNFNPAIVVAQATPTTLYFVGNISTSAANATHRFYVASTSNVSATGKNTGNSVSGSNLSVAGNGSTMTLVSSGNLVLSNVSGSGASPSVNQVVNVGTNDGVYFAFSMRSQYETQKITSLKLTATGTALATTTLTNIRLYQDSATTAFASAPQFDLSNGASSTVTFTASDNLLSAPIPTTGTTIYVKADIGAGGAAVLGNDFVFKIAATGDVAVKGSVTGLTTGTVTGTPTVTGITYVIPQNVAIEAVTPTTATTCGSTNNGCGASTQLAVFKITNNGSASIRLGTSTTFRFAQSGNTTSTFDVYTTSAQNQSYTAANTKLNTAATSTVSNYVNFTDIGDASAANRTIDGGSYRYIVIKNTQLMKSGDTAAFGVAALGDLTFQVDETSLGYDGDLNGSTSDTIQNLDINGTPSLSTLTAL